MMICATISPLISDAFTSQYLPATHVSHQHIQQLQVGLEVQMQWQRAALLCATQVHFSWEVLFRNDGGGRFIA